MRFPQSISFAVHKRFCDKFSITLTREYIKFSEFEKATKEDVHHERWSAAVLRCKPLNQWVTTIASVYDEDAVEGLRDMQNVFSAILARDADLLQP